MSRVCADRDAARPLEPFSQGDGLQLPGAGGVNGGELVFSSRAGGAAGASVFCAGESRGADAGALRCRRNRAASIWTLRRHRGSAWDGFRSSRARRRARRRRCMTGIPAATLEQVRETLEAQVSLRVPELDEADHGAGDRFAAHESAGCRRAERSLRRTERRPSAAVTPQSGSTATSIVLSSDGCGEVCSRLDRCAGCGLHRADGLCGRAGFGRICAAGADGCGLHSARDLQCRAGVRR